MLKYQAYMSLLKQLVMFVIPVYTELIQDALQMQKDRTTHHNHEKSHLKWLAIGE